MDTVGRWAKISNLLKLTLRGWSDDQASSWAAALAFYTMVSLGPVLFVTVTLCGLVLGAERSRSAVIEQLTGLLGPSTEKALIAMMEQAGKHDAGVWATVLGLVTLIAGTSGVFFALQDAFDAIWHVKPDPKASLWQMVKRRFFSLSIVAGLGFMLIVSLVISAGLAALQKVLMASLSLAAALAVPVEFATSLGLFTLAFAGMFRVLPDARLRWRDVWMGAFVTALLFNLGKLAIGLYLGHSNTTSAYGAAGSLALILLWVYYAAQIVFLGAEFTRSFTELYGTRVVAKDGAIKVQSVPVKE